MQFGYTLSSELHGPRSLVRQATAAEAAGFDFVSVSDHFHPWVPSQGHSPFVWSVLGAVATATTDIGVVVGVTCPTIRIHPAILAQATATTSHLLGDRFTWGVGSGEALNEQVLGDPWPVIETRLDMLEEAVALVRRLWEGASTTHHGAHYVTENATIFDPPPHDVPIVVSAFGNRAAEVAARIGDGLWTTGTGEDVIGTYRRAGGRGPVYSQLTLSWDRSVRRAVASAHERWPTTALPGYLNADLRTPGHFAHAARLVTEDMMSEAMPCGPHTDPIVAEVDEMVAAGVTHLYFHQVGEDIDGFLDHWVRHLRPALDGYRGADPSG